MKPHSARRDGTPDRGKPTKAAARSSAAKKTGGKKATGKKPDLDGAPRPKRAAPKSGSYDSREQSGPADSRGRAPRSGGASPDRRAAASSRTGATKAAPGKTGVGKSGFGKSGFDKSGFDKAAPKQAKKAAPRKGAPKKVVPVLSNAKPARRQHVEAAAEPVKLPWGEGERLQKVLAKAGVASRRAAEELIDAGRVEVDGATVRAQGLRINPETAVVRVDGVRVVVRAEMVYLALNKPQGWHSTMSDDMGRPCVGDLVAERVAAGQRLFHVGRLDAETEGLLLLTNDGDLAHRLMHPSFEVAKTYLASVLGEVDRGVAKRLKAGVELDDGPAKVDRFQVLDQGEGRALVKLVLHEGRKHIVRRLLKAVGHPVTGLVRTDIGPVPLGNQRPGTLRALTRAEVGKLYEAVGL
ncbi:MAG: rRNA pseudouridine synthase [Streptomycetaceae bacterium]|nr:rRNA pseudouridine synthase [Streptomycetaceae bacterium]